MGTPAPAAVSLQRLLDEGHDVAGVYTQPDRPSGRGNKIVFSPVKQIALDRGMRLFQPTKVRTADAAAEFAGLNADIAVVVAYGRILPESFLYAFPNGAVNVHFSLLPKYRGAAPVNWAIVNGETETGVTTMKMDTGLDTGDILLQRRTRIGDEETAPELMERLGLIGADLLIDTLREIESLTPIPQDEGAASFAPIMKREDGLIDWSMAAIQIASRVRGFQPFPGTFSYLDQKKVVIWKASADDGDENSSNPPGMIVSSDRRGITIAAGGGTVLQVEEVQFEGKRRMSVRDALNGVEISKGDRLISTSKHAESAPDTKK